MHWQMWLGVISRLIKPWINNVRLVKACSPIVSVFAFLCHMAVWSQGGWDLFNPFLSFVAWEDFDSQGQGNS